MTLPQTTLYKINKEKGIVQYSQGFSCWTYQELMLSFKKKEDAVKAVQKAFNKQTDLKVCSINELFSLKDTYFLDIDTLSMIESNIR